MIIRLVKQCLTRAQAMSLLIDGTKLLGIARTGIKLGIIGFEAQRCLRCTGLIDVHPGTRLQPVVNGIEQPKMTMSTRAAGSAETQPRRRNPGSDGNPLAPIQSQINTQSA